MLKDHLMILRVHTAALTQASLLIGHFLSGGILWSFDTFLWCMFGILFHASGFLHNNLCDYSDDKKDVHKIHHPLVSGAVSVDNAWQLNVILSVFASLLGAFLLRGSFIGLTILVTVIVCGWSYNLVCKKSLTAPIWISICFGFLVLLPYSVNKGLYFDDTIIWLVTAYATAQIWYQIAVEGYLKDLEHDPVNLLSLLGARIYVLAFGMTVNRKTVTWKCKNLSLADGAWYFAGISKIPMVVLGGALVVVTSSNMSFVILVIGVMAVIYGHRVLLDYRWNHNNVLRWCAIVEIVTYLTLLWLLYGLLDIWQCLFLTFYPLIWFASWNRLYFGTTLRPQV